MSFLESTWQFWASVVVSIAGWITVHSLASGRAAAGEEQTLIHEIRNNLEESVELTQLFMLNAGDQENALQKRQQIIHKMDRASRRCSELMQRDGRYDVAKKFNALKRLTTGGQFESADRAALDQDDEYFGDLKSSLDAVIKELVDSFNERHKRASIR